MDSSLNDMGEEGRVQEFEWAIWVASTKGGELCKFERFDSRVGILRGSIQATPLHEKSWEVAAYEQEDHVSIPNNVHNG